MKKIFLILSARFFDIAIGMICIIIILASVIVTSYASTITASSYTVSVTSSTLSSSKWNSMLNGLKVAINNNYYYATTFKRCDWEGVRLYCGIGKGGGHNVLIKLSEKCTAGKLADITVSNINFSSNSFDAGNIGDCFFIYYSF